MNKGPALNISDEQGDHLHHRSLTWPLKNGGWKTTFLLGRSLFRGYVKLREGIPSFFPPKKELQCVVFGKGSLHKKKTC